MTPDLQLEINQNILGHPSVQGLLLQVTMVTMVSRVLRVIQLTKFGCLYQGEMSSFPAHIH